MIDELRRNFLGFVLLLAGVGLVLLGTRVQISRLSDAGVGFIGMAGLALQVKLQGPKDPSKTDAAL
jgi:hypothetical protein